jgi:flagellar hook-basal body complex protein FliE
MVPAKGTLDFQETQSQREQDIVKPFSEFLGDALQIVNSLDSKSRQASIDLAAGKIEDISQVMIAAEKANIATQITLQVRNRVVEAYQEIMRMPV